LDLRHLLARPLGPSERARALGRAALILTGCVIWLAQRGPAVEEARSVDAGPTTPAPARAWSSEAPRRIARAFLAGFLPYSYGGSSTPPRADLLAPSLRAELARSTPALAGATPRRARVVSLTAETFTAGRARVVAGVDDGREAYPLTLELVRTDRWRVAAVGH
jgi:hypothetical protein